MIQVAGRGGETGMTQLLLNLVNGHPFRGQFRGMGMAQPMGMDTLVDAGAVGQPWQQRADIRRLSRFPGQGTEYWRPAG